MALTEWEIAQIRVAAKPYLEKWRQEFIKPAGYIHSIDLKIEGQSLIVYMMEEGFPTGSEDIYFPIAKATYRKVTNDWKLFWQMRDLKWHGYMEDMIHPDVESVFKCIDEDECCAFWG